MQRIDLGAALPMILEAYPHRQGEKVGEALLEPVAAGDLAAKICDRSSLHHSGLDTKQAGCFEKIPNL
jgi:hypothetical protein